MIADPRQRPDMANWGCQPDAPSYPDPPDVTETIDQDAAYVSSIHTHTRPTPDGRAL
jgi:hypothetical protein